MMSHQHSIYDDIIILYGSQRLRVAKAAKKFHAILLEHMMTRYHHHDSDDINHQQDETTTQTNRSHHHNIPLMTLDDFLKNDDIPWKRIVIILVSSFGTGGPPSGSKKFRQLCDDWINHHGIHDSTSIENPMKNLSEKDQTMLLDGIHFSMCGYGDSFYKTYMKNPTIITSGLKCVGATLIGNQQGMIDCNLDNSEEQIEEQFMEWVTAFWDPFDQIVDDIQNQYATNIMSITNEQLISMKRHTMRIVNNI
jgi:sulfite reductase alpha subunit-like flavoprotein